MTGFDIKYHWVPCHRLHSAQNAGKEWFAMNRQMTHEEILLPQGSRGTPWGSPVGEMPAEDRRPSGRMPEREGGGMCPFCAGRERLMPERNGGNRGGMNTNDSDMGIGRPCRAPGALGEYALAMVYTPTQQFIGLYELPEAMKRGTLFRALDMPWVGSEGRTGKGGCSCGRRER